MFGPFKIKYQKEENQRKATPRLNLQCFSKYKLGIPTRKIFTEKMILLESLKLFIRQVNCDFLLNMNEFVK